MSARISLLGRRTYKVTDRITVNIPTVRMVRGENIEDEDAFWREAGLFTMSPEDIPVELEDIGIDFTAVSEYSVFNLLYTIQRGDNADSPDLLFSNVNLWRLSPRVNEDKVEYVDENGDVVLNEVIYNRLSEVITLMVGRTKPKRHKFGNKYAKEHWLNSRRKHKERAAKKQDGDKNGSMLDGIILRLVCNANFPYNFETINDITLFDLLYSLKQIEKDISVSDLVQSRLVGVDLKKFPREQLDRFVL